MNSNSQIIKNASKGYGYTYSNLADLAKALKADKKELPVMKTQKVDGDEYVFAKIGDEWIQGAKVVEMEMKGMNAAQAYGSALTYARRYTVQLVMAIACDDDDKVEQDAEARRKEYKSNRIDFQEVRDQAKIIDDLESLQELYKSLNVEKMTEAQQKYINSIINQRKKELEK